MSEAARAPFHLAIPVDHIDGARAFYGGVLGLPEGRSAEHWVDWNLHGHQLVTHVAPGSGTVGHTDVDGHRVPVPHFGLVLPVDEFHAVAQRLREAGTRLVIEPYLRFAGEAGEQWTMFLHDPAGNAPEFTAFRDEAQLFAT
jgi:extradiol dioxygenase family protein